VSSISSQTPPESICILRLSAIGDTCHVLAVVRGIQDTWPDTKITWIIGRVEALLLGHIPGIEFIIFNKSARMSEYSKLRARLKNRRFDVLLHMQVAFRANLASAMIRADRRIGYDHARSKDLHGLFVNERIAGGHEQHVLDALRSFVTPLGVPAVTPRWDIPLSDEDFAYAEQRVDPDRKTLCISPVSSHKLRNWSIEGYAQVADHAASRHDMQVILTGGRGDFELEFNAAVAAAMRTEVMNLTGSDTLTQLAATLERCDLLLAPDTGPMHIATAVGTDVLGLHAASNPRRSGPYNSIEWCVDQYDAAARKYLKRGADEIPWGTKIEHTGVMDLITVEQVIDKLDAWVAQSANGSLDL
jgi:heptosyltransferase I